MNFIMNSKELNKLATELPNEQGCRFLKNNEILLTGAAGFLGIHLLKKLVLMKSFKKIHVIVRHKPKLMIQAKKYRLGIEWLQQVNVIEGDLLSLDVESFPLVEFVVHGAAEVHCLKTLPMLWKDNVLVTNRLSHLYKESKFYFISSLSVFVSSNLSGEHQPIQLADLGDYNLYGGYAQSKFIGELIAEKNKQNIIRLGLITGSSKTGVNQKGFFIWVLDMLKQIECCPNEFEEAWVDVSPVDLVCDEIIQTIFNDEKISHIANKKSLSLTQIVDYMKLKRVNRKEWEEKIEKLDSIGKILMNFAFFKEEAIKQKIQWFNIDLFQSTNHSYAIKEEFSVNNENLLKLYLNVLEEDDV